MSKFLKVVVNLFLVCAILVGAAILVPPLMGITTTVIDSSSMNTNLPVGSVTYARDIHVTDIQPGDKLIYESDAKTYVYEVQEANAGSGKFTVRDTRSTSGQTEEITLRNNASEVVLTVPFIGYLMMAMHSTEGLIIIGLVVLFIIILFILSELWKKPAEDEEDDEDEDEDETDDSGKTEEPDEVTTISEEEPEQSTMTEEEAMALAREELIRAVAESQGQMELQKEEPAQTESGEETLTEKDGDVAQIQEEVSDENMEESAQQEQQMEEPDEEEADEEEPDTFIPVARPTAQELLKKAEKAGEQPKVQKDENLGITLLDYSELL